jgi:hypothetical protein
VQSQPPGRGPVSCLTGGVDHRCGPVADMARFSRQGPCRNTRPKHLPRPVQAAAGATRVEGPEEGRVSKPTSTCVRGPRLSGGGRHPASSGPSAVSATQVHVAFRWFHLNDNVHAPLKTSYLRHCPRAALRTILSQIPAAVPRGPVPAVRMAAGDGVGRWLRGMARSAPESLVRNRHPRSSSPAPAISVCRGNIRGAVELFRLRHRRGAR